MTVISPRHYIIIGIAAVAITAIFLFFTFINNILKPLDPDPGDTADPGQAGQAKEERPENIVTIDNLQDYALYDQVEQVIARNRITDQDNLIYEQAVSNKNWELCLDMHSATTTDHCLMKMAHLDMDASQCGRIKNKELAKRCQDEIHYEQALLADDLEKCGQISGQKYFDMCADQLIESNQDEAKCRILETEYDPEIMIDPGVDRYQVCLAKARYYQAVAEGSLEKCSAIRLDVYRAWCHVEVTGIAPDSDEDGDGLTYFMEIYYRTDPNNPDSDGDGFSDYEEIMAGFDPNDSRPGARLPVYPFLHDPDEDHSSRD